MLGFVGHLPVAGQSAPGGLPSDTPSEYYPVGLPLFYMAMGTNLCPDVPDAQTD